MTADVGVLTVVVVALVVWAVRRGLILAAREPGDRGPAAVVLAVVLAMLVPAVAVEARHQWTQARATEVVRELSGDQGATARCQRFTADLVDVSQNSGFVSYDHQDRADLRRTVCNDLFGWLTSSRSAPTTDQVIAVHVLVHESMHVAGDFVESSAECSAMQNDARAAVLLGATAEQARALAVAYLRDVYPRMSPEYTSGGCVQDGAMDLTPGDGAFP